MLLLIVEEALAAFVSDMFGFTGLCPDKRQQFRNKASLKEYTINFYSLLLYNYAAFFAAAYNKHISDAYDAARAPTALRTIK